MNLVIFFLVELEYINQKHTTMERKELIIRTPRNEKIFAVYNNENLSGFVIEGTGLLNMKAYLMLREIFSEDHAEKNCCKMILTLFDVLPVREEWWTS